MRIRKVGVGARRSPERSHPWTMWDLGHQLTQSRIIMFYFVCMCSAETKEEVGKELAYHIRK